jgi:molybdenum cofactor synthesis domain-containing protein
MARVEALCTSAAKGDRKKPAASAVFRAGHGIEGDAHAGPWHRQVSLLAAEDIAAVRKSLGDLAPGDFAENVIVSGLDLAGMGLGTRLWLGQDVVLSITQIGKVCHAPCRIAKLTGDCLMPRAGLFARVETGGTVRPGDEATVLTLVPRGRLQAVILTISDRGSRGERTDTAGPAVAKQLAAAMDVNIYRTEILPDDAGQIAARLKHYADGHSIDLVVTVGGTGFSPRDVTPEATRAVVERPTPGLDEAMRAASLAKTPHAMLSRGTSGIRGTTLIVNLPGSERAARENLAVILPALPHGLEKLRGDTSECGPPHAAQK